MSLCIGFYPDGTQLGTAGSPAGFVTTAGNPIAKITVASSCASGETLLYTKSEVDAAISASASSGGTVTYGTMTHVVTLEDPAFDQHIVDFGVNAQSIAMAMAFGLGFVLLFWSFGYIAALAKGLINKL